MRRSIAAMVFSPLLLVPLIIESPDAVGAENAKETVKVCYLN